ncbi:MAG TPA: hypothetical protein VGP07_07255 [Polyangia bacterium]|jgi:hypothetical protein
MNPTQRNKVPSPRTGSSRGKPDPELPDDRDTAEEVIHESRTSQDRDHTIRRGDNTTGVTKEFPT